jgi:hypothetical protein
MRGPPGKEVDVPILNLQSSPTTFSYGDVTRVDNKDCRRYQDPKMLGRSWLADASQQFYLDFGPSAGSHSEHNLILERADGTERRELQIPSTFLTICTHSHQFTSAFFAWNCLASPQASLREWQATNCWPIWKIALPGGEVEKICLPYGAWAGASIEIIPTKAGMFFTSMRQSTNNPHSPDEAGLYRLENGTVKRVLPGLIAHTARFRRAAAKSHSSTRLTSWPRFLIRPSRKTTDRRSWRSTYVRNYKTEF